MKYEAVIGLEVHVHLKTKTKAFCACPNEFGKEANTQVCPVCLGLPGSLPVLNQVAFDFAIKTGIALNCSIQKFTKFDRKNYFYPDLPKNYQISQYDMPLSSKGYLDINIEGRTKRIRITRVHLEEDAGKLIHRENESLVDFNRAGIPLLEIVSEPDINSPQEAYEYLTRLKSILQYLEVSDCDMEKGSLRCDANVSIRKPGTKELGTKTELKNMNSFKGVKEALEYEIIRQEEALNEGKTITQETRLWDAKTSVSVPMRTKEGAKDYRYFPDPDLPMFIINEEKIEEIRNSIPELPEKKISRFIKEYGLSEYDAKIIVSEKRFADLTESRFKAYQNENKKAVANWSIGPILEAAGSLNCLPHELEIPGGEEELLNLIRLVEESKISNLAAKSVFTESLSSKKTASLIIKEKDLFQISDSGSLEKFADEVISENIKSVQDFKAGKDNAIMFLVGQMMKKSKGKANPKTVQDILRRRLENV